VESDTWSRVEYVEWSEIRGVGIRGMEGNAWSGETYVEWSEICGVGYVGWNGIRGVERHTWS